MFEWVVMIALGIIIILMVIIFFEVSSRTENFTFKVQTEKIIEQNDKIIKQNSMIITDLRIVGGNVDRIPESTFSGIELKLGQIVQNTHRY